MRALPRIVAVVVAVIAAISGPSCTYPDEPVAEAVARLRPVQAGTLDALTGDEVRELCLNAGKYVLAFARAPGPESGVAAVDHPVADELIADSAFIHVSTDSQEEWEWDTFTVWENTCLEFEVIYGRARVYELYVGVPW